MSLDSQDCLFDDAECFWQWIDKARAQAGGASEEMCEILIEQLSVMEIKDIVRWHQHVEAYTHIAHKNKLWCAADLMNGGASDDGFEYFKGWLIAQGKIVYAGALLAPDSLADAVVAESEGLYELEAMFTVGCDSYFLRLGIDDPSETEYGDFFRTIDELPLPQELVQAEFAAIGYSETMHEDIADNWSEGIARPLLPRLYAIFGENNE